MPLLSIRSFHLSIKLLVGLAASAASKRQSDLLIFPLLFIQTRPPEPLVQPDLAKQEATVFPPPPVLFVLEAEF